MGHAGAIVRHPNGLFEGASDPQQRLRRRLLGDEHDAQRKRLARLSGANGTLLALELDDARRGELQLQFAALPPWPSR
jgi:hypothetical protein